MLNKEDRARLAGMDYALRQIEQGGIDAFRDELCWRCGRGFTVPISRKDIAKAVQMERNLIIEKVCEIATVALADTFDFSPEQCADFAARVNDIAAQLGNEVVKWGDEWDAILNSLGIEMETVI